MMSTVFLWIVALLAGALCADAIALAVSIQRQVKGAGLAGALLLLDCLPLAVALAPGGYKWCAYVGYGALSLHLLAILVAARVDTGRIAGIHTVATILFCAHLFFLVNAP
jgi:hypothetical protein